MIRSLQNFICWTDAANEYIGRSIAWLTLAMVIVTFAIVVLRYIFDVGWIAMQELVTYMHTIVFMLGAAYTLKRDGHVRVDIIYQRCNGKTQAWINFYGSLFLLLPVTGFILASSWDYVADSWAIYESSRSSGGLPGVFLIKSLIPIMALLLFLQGLSLAASSLLTALDWHEAK